MPLTTISSLEDLPDAEGLATLNKAGIAPELRVSSPGAAYRILAEMQRLDRNRASNRASIQAMFDGEAPYRAADLIATGQGSRSNLNFDEAGALLEHAMSGYVDLFTSTELFMNVKLQYGTYPEPLKKEKEQAISAAFTRLLRKWPSFFAKFLRNCHHFLTEGVGVCYFIDTFDWRWQVAKFGEFYLPDNTKADMDSLEQAGGIQNYRVAELYAKIKNPDAATKLGWDVAAVKDVLVNAAANVKYPGKVGDMADWESLQVSIKNNDAFWSTCSSEIPIAHLWVKEFSEKWSHFMFLYKDEQAKFLYKKENKFTEGRTPFFIFPYGLGSNGYFHGIRGLGHKIYPHIQVSNRLLNQAVDSAMLSSSLLIQPKTEEDLNNLALTYYGPYSVLPPGHSTVERTALPNLTQNAMPMIADMGQRLQTKTGQYSSLGAFADDKERTRFEMEAYVARLAKLSITSLNLFYEPWELLMRETLCRVASPHYGANIPGGAAVMEMKRRLHVLGVSSEDLAAIDFDDCCIYRAVGGGSPEARQATLTNLSTMAPAMDEIGRHHLLRDRVANLLGSYEQADRYVPDSPAVRTGTDDKMAMLENGQLIQGMEIMVLPHELHLVHLKIHMARLTEFNDSVQKGQSLIQDVLEPMTLLHAHSTEHIEAGGDDPFAVEAYAYFRQALQHVGETIWNGHKAVEAEARKAQQKAAESGQPEDPNQAQGLNPQLVKMLNEHNLKLRLREQEHQQKMQQQQAVFAQKQAMADAANAAKISAT